MKETLQKYDDRVIECKAVFVYKLMNYGASWRVMRLSTVLDQLYMKVRRIRTLEITKTYTVNESIQSGMQAVVNYAVIGLIQTELKYANNIDITYTQAVQLFDEKIQHARELMINKNTDYGQAWRAMKRSSLTDIILTKILRCKSMVERPQNNESIEDNFYDMINYAIFYLIQ